MFSNATLREIARCLNVPLFFLTLDATQANMSSAYVAIQPFIRSVQVDRAGYDRLNDRILDEFLTELVHLVEIGALELEGLTLGRRTGRWPAILHQVMRRPPRAAGWSPLYRARAGC
jgi:hypothetical protein